MELTDARSLSPEAQQALRERVVHAVVEEGKSVAEAARLAGVHRSTASGWVNAFRRGGEDALAAKKRGRPKGQLLGEDRAEELLADIRAHTPEEMGLAEALWTREAVGDLARCRYGLDRSRWVWGRWLKAQGFTPQKPARRAVEQDPEAVRRWLEEDYPRIEAEAKAEGAEVHWLDEAGLRSDCQAGRGYAPEGQTPVAPVSGNRFGVNFVATLTNLGVMRFMVYAGSLTQAVFIAFLSRLIGSAGRKVYLILDGHPAHRGKKVREWVAARAERVRLVYLPAYSPELNPVELLNNDVKANAQRSGRAGDGEELAEKLRSYLRATQRVARLVSSEVVWVVKARNRLL